MLEELQELFEHDIYAKTYGNAFTDKIEQLARVITQEYTKPNEFNVFALEAGLGKSKYTNHIISKNLYDFGKTRKYLVVKKFKEGVEEMEKALSHFNPPKGYDDKPNILGITADNWGAWRLNTEKLKHVSVLIITHKRYIDLALNDELRQAFSDDRDVLIIDEKVSFPIYSFSKSYYDNVRSILPFNLQADFDKVCNRILKELQIQGVDKKNLNKCVRVELNIHPVTLNHFLEVMEVNIENFLNLKERNSVQHFLEGLELWYSTKCVYNGGNISTFNRKHMLWGLQNNIILDASSNVDGIYQISNSYKVIGEERIIDHRNSTFFHINFNTSKSNLNHNQERYFKEVAEKIVEHNERGENNQTLIICHKDNYKKIEEQMLRLRIADIAIPNNTDTIENNVDNVITERFAINWFGNLIGKNAYADFTQCWIIGTPNIPYEQYLIHYMMYAREEHLGNKSLDIERGRFKNNDFNKVQNGYLASEIYQSIKRIQRNERPEGDFFIVNSDKAIVKKILKQIKGTDNQQEKEFQFVQEQKKNKKRDKVDELVDYLMRLPEGEYQKKDIIEELSLTNLNRLLTDTRVKDLVETGHININYRKIVKLKN